MAKKRLQVFYSGDIQGVGFRFATKLIAKGLNIDGIARNLPDGRVEVVCEGEETELTEFLEEIKNSHIGHRITNADISWLESKNEFSGFDTGYF